MENTKNTYEPNVSAIGFVKHGIWAGTLYFLYPRGRSYGKLGRSHDFGNWKQHLSTFRKAVFHNSLEFQTMDKVHKFSDSENKDLFERLE
jgi:hypothetical protein